MRQPIAFATTQPNVYYNGGGPGGVGGCVINDDSELKIGNIQTNPKCRISLQERPLELSPT